MSVTINVLRPDSIFWFAGWTQKWHKIGPMDKQAKLLWRPPKQPSSRCLQMSLSLISKENHIDQCISYSMFQCDNGMDQSTHTRVDTWFLNLDLVLLLPVQHTTQEQNNQQEVSRSCFSTSTQWWWQTMHAEGLQKVLLQVSVANQSTDITPT